MLNAEELRNALRRDGALLVDARRSDLYNGWSDGCPSWGGHAPGAVSFDAGWLDVCRDDLEERLSEALSEKGMTPDRELLLYDVGGKETARLGEWLRRRGFKRLSSFDLGIWARADGRPLERYPGYGLLVSAFALRERLEGRPAETFDSGRGVKVVEASKGGAEVSHALGHVPGAVHLDVDHLYSDKNLVPETRYRLADPKALEEAALALGITSEDCVVVTGASPMAMCRAAWALHYLGVRDVRVLNGGLGAWKRRGYALSTEAVRPVPASSFGIAVPGRGEVLRTIDEIEALRSDWGTSQLVDIRSLEEYRGDVSGYDHQEIVGHIPGAVLGYAGLGDPHSLDYYRNVDDTMRQDSEILSLWRRCGIDWSRHLIFSCGMGWRAAEVWFYARAMGLNNVSKYSDGWIRWSNSGYPVETGGPGGARREVGDASPCP